MKYKSICKYCEGLLEFAAEQAGQTIPCPHCGESAALPVIPAAPASKPSHLASCPDCGNRVSTAAEHCPQCGRPLVAAIMAESRRAEQAVAKENQAGKIIFVIILLIVAGYFVWTYLKAAG